MRNKVWRKNENSKRFNAILWVQNEKIGSRKNEIFRNKTKDWRNDAKRL